MSAMLVWRRRCLYLGRHPTSMGTFLIPSFNGKQLATSVTTDATKATYGMSYAAQPCPENVRLGIMRPCSATEIDYILVSALGEKIMVKWDGSTITTDCITAGPYISYTSWYNSPFTYILIIIDIPQAILDGAFTSSTVVDIAYSHYHTYGSFNCNSFFYVGWGTATSLDIASMISTTRCQDASCGQSANKTITVYDDFSFT